MNLNQCSDRVSMVFNENNEYKIEYNLQKFIKEITK